MSEFTLINHRGEKTKTFSDRATADEKRGDMIGLGADPGDFEVVQGAYENYAEYADELDTVGNQRASDADNDVAQSDGGTEAEVVESDPDVVDESVTDQLPDDGPSISEDPLTWMPNEFIKTVDGSPTITRKGYEVLAHHYDIQGGTQMVVSPVETEMDYAVHKATVTDVDGEEYSAYGEAHASDNGVENIVRMSDTRAYKRAVSRATGVGTVAIEELQNDL